MNHEGHIVIGLITGIVAATLLKIAISPQLIALVILGATLPDIDIRKSKISKVIEFTVVIGGTVFLQPLVSHYGILSWLIAFVISALSLLILLFPLRLKHRGITHSYFTALVFAVAVAIAVNLTSGAIAFLTYSSHLVVDKI